MLGLAMLTVAQDPDLARATPIVEAERAFAKKTAEVGVRDGFLEFVADDGVLFSPLPVNAKETLTKSEKQPGKLVWEPATTMIASSGDLGFNVGPWEFFPQGATKAASHGNFFTIWKKQADGSWKWVIDFGVDTAKPGVFPKGKVTARKAPALKPEQARIDHSSIEWMLNRSASHPTAQPMYAKDLIFLRSAKDPLFPDKLPTFQKYLKLPGTWEFETLGKGASAANDLAYTYGKANYKYGRDNFRYGYVRVWERGENGSWRVCLDVMNPAPETP